MAESGNDVDSLELQIGNIIEENKNHLKQHYASRDHVDSLITLETVANRLGKRLKDETVKYIVKNAKLITVSLADMADKLPYHKLTDNYLPVFYDRMYNKHRFSQTVQGLNNKTFQLWARAFCNQQWKVLVPIFNNYEIVYPLHEEHRLPFIEYEPNEEATGAAGIVAQAKVYEAHLTYTTASRWVVIKKIKYSSDKLFQKIIQREVAALDLVRRLRHPHLIKFIASYSQGGQHSLIFEWANGGNLRQFWKKASHEEPDRQRVIQWAIEQITGLAGALNKLHNPEENGLNCRHGNLKPANIIITKQNMDDLGRLLITDLGLSKVNDQGTRIRRTSGTYNITVRYQSPEFRSRLSPDTPTSRSYDMWSMGCIMLEFIIWLLYGGDQLDEFTKACPSYFFDDTNLAQGFELNFSVKHWISHMKATAIGKSIALDRNVSRALTDTLDLVERSLLQDASLVVVTRPEGSIESNDSSEGSRMTSKSLQRAMVDIKARSRNPEDYLFQPVYSPLTPPPAQPASSQNLQVPEIARPPTLPSAPQWTPQNNVGQANTQNEYIIEPMHYLDSYPDNQFALSIFPEIESTAVIPSTSPVQTWGLCGHCSHESTGVFSNQFIFDHKVLSPDSRCGFCDVLSKYLEDDKQNKRLVRRGPYLTKTSPSLPVYFLIVGPGISAAPNDLQRTFPILPESGRVSDLKSLPTRLVSVGDVDDHSVKLILSAVLTEEGQDSRYIALSHRWKYPDGMDRTLEDNENIELEELPANFRDAIKVSRALRVPYLWIDSLCIIQDNPDDWIEECSRMREVYNGAYCTVAATRAKYTTDGFLGSRIPRPCTKIHTEKTPSGKEADVYLVKSIDDFNSEVEKAELNTRGWVLQERALSRRILHFAESQVYMEWGGGICCETTTRMFNRASFFYSDADFPSQAVEFYRGMKIRYYETIYTEYSNRKFSEDHDRAVALEGLESKILKAYETSGCYGIQRGKFSHEDLMKLIPRDKPKSRAIMDKVPTWSWMKLIGPIQYFPIDMGSVDWSNTLVWSLEGEDTGQAIGLVRVDRPGDLFISAPAYKIHPDAYLKPKSNSSNAKRNVFILDRFHLPTEVQGLRCVVIATQKHTQKLKYVLLVAPRLVPTGDDRYERVGVAKIEREYIIEGKEPCQVKLI
ncbi:hypothetical protein F4680DRAFT_458632 [Xylaria scruposa]|nr:hypothetical protein F4680DRAFT_458632 [Xylaria scruposa]